MDVLNRAISNAASSVAVAGDFSRWKPIPLSPRQVNGQTVWTAALSLPHGAHHYMFVLDGKHWVTDPLAPAHQKDGFGRTNAVLFL